MVALGLDFNLFGHVGVDAGVTASCCGEVELCIDGGKVGMMLSSMSHFGDTPRATGNSPISF